MCQTRNPFHCIVPPHMLKAMVENKDRRVRDAALRAMAQSARIRGRREVLGAVRASLALATSSGLNRIIYDAQRGTQLPPKPSQKVREEGEPPSSDPAVNEVYDGFGHTYEFYKEVFDRNSIDDNGMSLVGVVHFDEDWPNAIFDGSLMAFGDGDGVVFQRFSKSLDVIAHELAHGVTDSTCGLIYHLEHGALNESFSDVFGSLVKQYHLNQAAAQADWLIGADLLMPGINGVALRSMKDPGSAFDDPKLGGKDPQPKHMDDFVVLPDTPIGDFGGVHYNSGIPNHAFYLVADELGGHAWEDAGTIWYNSLLQLWPTAQFKDCANVTTQVAGTLFGSNSKQQIAVRSAWEAVGVEIAAPSTKPTHGKKKPVPVELNGAFKAQLKKLSDELLKTIELIP